MAKFLALLVIGLTCAVVNAQRPASDQKPVFGQTFDEIVVSSDLNVRRKSKENRQGKRLLSNVPSGTTGPPEKSTVFASRPFPVQKSGAASGGREKRGTVALGERYLDMGAAGYLLDSRKR